MEVMNYMTEYCCANDRMDPHDLTVVLDELMDEEFETWCQDNSTQGTHINQIKILVH